ncbi:MAG: type II secretion system protein N [Pseudomonadota bacterium]
MLDTLITRGAEPVKWLVLVGIAYTLASTIWTFFTTPIAPPLSTGPAATTQQAIARAPVNINWVLSKHLFGEAGSAPESAVTSNEPAVPTSLQLELQAVFVADVPEDSAAIIAQRGKTGQHYRVGTKVPGNATLIDVSDDRVYLRRAGVRETLAFPKAKFSVVVDEQTPPASNNSRMTDRSNRTTQRPEQGSTQSRPSSRPSSATAEQTSSELTPDQVVDNYQEKLKTDAPGTLAELGLESADGGGYLLGNNAQSAYLKRTGLQPGDRIMSVNGRPVGNIQQDRLEMENVLAQGSARIEVLRGSRRFFVTVSLNN